MHVPLLLAGFVLTGSAMAAVPRGTACCSVLMHYKARPWTPHWMHLVMAPASARTHISECGMLVKVSQGASLTGPDPWP